MLTGLLLAIGLAFAEPPAADSLDLASELRTQADAAETLDGRIGALERELEIRTRLQGGDHADTLGTLELQIDAMYRNGRAADALELQRDWASRVDGPKASHALARGLIAAGHYGESIEILRALDPDRARHALVDALRGLGQRSEALDLLEADPEVATVQVDIAELLAEMGDLERALEIYTAAEAPLRVAQTLCALGRTDEGLALAHETPDGVVTALQVEGVCRGLAGDRRRALHTLEAATEVRAPSDVLISELAEQRGLAGDAALAVGLREEVVARRVEVNGDGHPALIEPLADLGAELMRAGEQEEGLARFTDARDIALDRLGPSSPRTARLDLRMADVRIGREELTEAESLLNGALEVLQSGPEHCEGLARLGELHLLRGDLESALAQFRASRECDETARAIRGQGHAQLASGQHKEAADLFRLALEQSGPGAAAADRLPLLHDLAVAISKDSLEESLYLRQDTFAAAASHLRKRLPLTTAIEGNRLLDSYRFAVDDLASIGVLEPEKAWRGLVEWKALHDLTVWPDASLTVSPGDVCEGLAAGRVMVDFAQTGVGERASYLAFAIDDGCEVAAVDLGFAGAIEAALSDPERVHELVWRPLEGHVGDATEVVIVPDGRLAEVSFAALPSGDGYLVERHTFRYLRAASALVVEEQTPGKDTLYVDSLKPRSPREFEWVSRELRKRRRKEQVHAFTVDVGATDVLRASLSGKRVVHLAVPWPGGQPEGLDLRGVELIVSTDPGPGAAELSNSFAQAGAGSAIVALWTVPPKSTEILMREFYRRLLGKRGLDPAGALREAQLTLLADSRSDTGQGHARDWGAFIAEGP